jgi:murein DD-endopeptidase MepM/ murein hydrolase activator NlpD
MEPLQDNIKMSEYCSNTQKYANFFRLAVILCLAFTILPGYTKKYQEIAGEEHGIGGSVLFEEPAENENGLVLLTASLDIPLETAVIESETFFKHRTLLFDSHTVQSGENISTLAINFGLNQDTIISINKITNSRLLQIGRVLRIPNQDGILHTVSDTDTLSSIAEKYKGDSEAIKTANELFSDTLRAGTDLFIPGAKLDLQRLQEINGDLFIWPVNGAITSPFGYRRDPFGSGRRSFHTGMDIRGSMGTPIRAAMSGRVSQVGYDAVLGNYVVINHHSGYRTLYAHMSVIRTRTGASVAQGERIGDVGSTGLSTGPHLHFTVYKDGVLVNPRPLLR